MTITAKIIADSLGEGIPKETHRLTTFELRYNRYVHSEVMTHRVFSRNASSSRAIPIKRLIEEASLYPALPVHWGKAQAGMQANEELSGEALEGTKAAWHSARFSAVKHAQQMADLGAAKQVVNRILEPYTHITVVVTASNYDNFFHLRRHKDAQPEIKVLADKMFKALMASEPRLLKHGMWHLPYVPEADHVMPINMGNGNVGDQPRFSTEELIKMSVARCARVSYLTHDGAEPDYAADAALYDRLVGNSPLHASPAEHQATPDRFVWGGKNFQHPELNGNFGPGWVQFRKTLPGENFIRSETFKEAAQWHELRSQWKM